MSLEQELVKQINSLQKQVDGLIKPEISIDIISSFLALPGLVGFWPMSSVQRSTGNAYDLSGQARILTYNGNPAYNIYNNFVPYINLDGTGDYLSRADETDLDILGTETIYAAAVRGLTLGGWFWFDSVAGVTPGLIGKWTSTGNQKGYHLSLQNGVIVLFLSADGSTTTTFSSAITPATGAWYFIVGKFTPSTEYAIFINGVKYSSVAGVIASIFNNTSAFTIGNLNGVLHTGRASLCFLCANALPDDLISALFSQTRPAFAI